jgi:WD40-like Beta Propeller Repeat
LRLSPFIIRVYDGIALGDRAARAGHGLGAGITRQALALEAGRLELTPAERFRRPLVLVTALLLLLLAGIATATYIGVRATARDNGPVTLIGGAGISTIGPDGRLHTIVRCPPTVECGALQSVDWSPDGRSLAYSINTFAAGSPHAGLHVLDTSSGKDKHILGGELGCLAPIDLDWSPDGARLVYACEKGAPHEPASGIYLIEPDGSNGVLLRTALVRSPLFSVVVAGREADRVRPRNTRAIGDLHLRPCGLSYRTLLVAGGSAPAWSPDGKTIAYQVDCGVKFATPTGRDVTPIPGPLRVTRSAYRACRCGRNRTARRSRSERRTRGPT